MEQTIVAFKKKIATNADAYPLYTEVYRLLLNMLRIARSVQREIG
jgi:hypothetical protein